LIGVLAIDGVYLGVMCRVLRQKRVILR